MPHYEQLKPMAVAQKWKLAIGNARKRRVSPEVLGPLLRELATEGRARPEEIADIVVGLRTIDGRHVDPLMLQYTELLLRSRYTRSSCLLQRLLHHTSFRKPTSPDHAPSGLPTFEERLFTMLRQNTINASFPNTSLKAHEIIWALGNWLLAVSNYEKSKLMDSDPLRAVDPADLGMYEALGLLAISVFSHRGFRDVEKHPWWKKRRAMVATLMEQFDVHVLQFIRSQYAGHLQALSKTRPFLETDERGMPAFSEQQVLASVTDLPVLNSRAGLFVWLNACLSARPLTDDTTVRNYLLVRYGDDAQTAGVALILAAFDVLTSVILRQESRQSVKVVRSFICDKVPLLLHSLSGYMGPGGEESCIQMALMSVSVDPLAPLTTGATEIRDLLKKTRLDFLQTCVLHSLVSEITIAGIIQEPTLPPSKHVKYSKESLLHQCTDNMTRLEALIQELDHMQGNAGAISCCIVDTVSSLCTRKDTIALKSVSNALLKKIPNLDIIMQYTQPVALLLPLCNILNDWVHDQDQSEFQLVYEEFASILLFTLVLIHRYDLRRTDTGLANDDNFMARLLQDRSQSIAPSELNDEQNKQLSKWIEGLYATDEHGETTGIGDEVMSHCPPQAFYILAPTLFEQSVLACKSKALSISTVKGGLEFLLEPFLLPSLIGGLSWLVKHSWEDHGDADVLLQILDKLLKPSSSSQETQTMHKAILVIVADDLERSLQSLIRNKPEKKKEAGGLVDLLKPYLNQQRTKHCSTRDLAEWVTNQEGGIGSSVRKAVRSIIAWAAAGASSSPPVYAQRLLWASHLLVGGERTLDFLTEELASQTSIGSGSIALDVCAGLVCAPEPDAYAPLIAFGTSLVPSHTDVLVLRDHLRFIVAQPHKLLDMPVNKAEAVIRLSRKVEAQLSVSQMALVNLTAPTNEQAAADEVMQELGLASIDASTGAGGDAALGQQSTAGFGDADFSAAAGQAMDLTDASAQEIATMATDSNLMQLNDAQDLFGDLNMDLGQQSLGDGMGDGNGGGTNPEDDIFAGLDMGNLEDFTFT